jgi:alginate O-acetyltransferase complex protein AlgI
MVFSSQLFLFYFLPAALLLYFASPYRLRNLTLTLTSYLFYGWANPFYLVLIAWSTAVDYCCGNLIGGYWRLLGPITRGDDGEPRASELQRRLFVGVSLVSNLGLLGFFKYGPFIQQNYKALSAAAGAEPGQILKILLPVGISFYTFESISYTLDIYFGRARPALADVLPRNEKVGPLGRLLAEMRALVSFACYITQFPHLVAGPIIRYQDLEAQLHNRTHTFAKFGRGVFFFSLGLAKKVLVANPAGEVADLAFNAAPLHPLDAWYGLFGYAFQIYFDFSGYSDMAIGLGLMVGFEFVKNFDSPYKSQSVTEFWRRWHISLSTWLRDYLYVPLGGNRKGQLRTYANLMTVMLLGGLWHGAAWPFLVWGAIHGGWLCLERVLDKRSFYARAPAVARVAVTFLIVNLAWVFFRAKDLSAGVEYLGSLFGLVAVPATAALPRGDFYNRYHAFWMVTAAALAFFGVQTWDLARRVTPLRAALAVVLLLWSVAALCAQAYNPFLYFQF